MTVETPFHGHGFGFPHQGHSVHLTMTACTADTLGHMDAVIKVDIIGHTMDACPNNGLPCAIALAHRFQGWAIILNLGVATHTGVGRGDAGKGGNFNRCMTIATINAEVTNMVFVAKLHRLRAGNAHISHIGGPGKH